MDCPSNIGYVRVKPDIKEKVDRVAKIERVGND